MTAARALAAALAAATIAQWRSRAGRLREHGDRRRLDESDGAAIKGANPLADGETASVPATASGSTRYLFALPKFQGNSAYEKDMLPPANEAVVLRGVARPRSVTLLRDGSRLEFQFVDNVLRVQVPASVRTRLVDVVEITLPTSR